MINEGSNQLPHTVIFATPVCSFYHGRYFVVSVEFFDSTTILKKNPGALQYSITLFGAPR